MMVHKSKLTEAAVTASAGASAEDRTLGLSYADDVTGIGAANDDVLQHRKERTDDGSKRSRATHDEVIARSEPRRQ
jgi:hypothetical protein